MECLNHLVMTIWGFASEAPSTAKQAIFESVLGAWTIWCTEFMWPKRVFFFFPGIRGFWSYPFYTRIVRSFMYIRRFPQEPTSMLGMTGGCSKHRIHHSQCCYFIFQAILRHRTNFFGSSIDFSQAGMMSLSKISKGLTRGGAMTSSVDLVEAMYPWTQLWHMVSWELGACFFARPRCSRYGGCIYLTCTPKNHPNGSKYTVIPYNEYLGEAVSCVFSEFFCVKYQRNRKTWGGKKNTDYIRIHKYR